MFAWMEFEDGSFRYAPTRVRMLAVYYALILCLTFGGIPGN